MADHRAEQVLNAVKAALASDGSFEVLRAPVDALTGTLQQIPAACLFAGEAIPRGEDGFEVIGSYREALEIFVDLWHQADRSSNIETKLNELRKRTHIAILQTAALGLSFVIRVIPAGTDVPELSASGDSITGKLRTIWVVEYSTSVEDPST